MVGIGVVNKKMSLLGSAFDLDSYHVKLFISSSKMNRCASAIVLGDKIWICIHDFGELFRVT
jgi:hypothetical protein